LEQTNYTAGTSPRIYATWKSLAEEARIAPAYMIGISGCHRGCLFCHARSAWQEAAGELLTSDRLATHFARARQENCRTIQFTGGEPAHHLAAIVAALPPPSAIPLVLNTSLSDSLHPALLEPFSTIIVSLKFGNDNCSKRLGGGRDYLAPIRQRLLALLEARIPLRIRHLVMPGHVDCCLKSTLVWLQDCLPMVPLTLLLGFVPPAHALVPELSSSLPPAARDAALALATRSGLCWEAVGEQIPRASLPPAGSEYVDVVIDAGGAVCLPVVGPAAQALAVGLTAPEEEEIRE